MCTIVFLYSTWLLYTCCVVRYWCNLIIRLSVLCILEKSKPKKKKERAKAQAGARESWRRGGTPVSSKDISEMIRRRRDKGREKARNSGLSCDYSQYYSAYDHKVAAVKRDSGGPVRCDFGFNILNIIYRLVIVMNNVVYYYLMIKTNMLISVEIYMHVINA